MLTYYRATGPVLRFTEKASNAPVFEFPTDTIFKDLEDPTADENRIKVAKLAVDGFVLPSWIDRSSLELLEHYAPFSAYSEAEFVAECVSRAWTTNDLEETPPFYTDRDYLLALASIQSGLNSGARKGPNQERIGIFGMTEEEWNGFLQSPVGKDYTPDAILNPYAQISGAIFHMLSDARTLSEMWRQQQNIGTNDDPYMPRFGELLRCRLIGLNAAFAMQVKLKEGDDGIPLDKFLRDQGLQADELLTDRKRFMRQGNSNDGDPYSLKVFHDKCVEILNKELKDAFSLIKQHVPEAVTIVGGNAPWLPIAIREWKPGAVSEKTQEGRSRIHSYFQSTGFTQGTHADKWCAAFVAWCLDQCGGAVRDSYSKFRNNAAASAAWRSWGTVSIDVKNNPPPGAVVVLSPSDKTDEISHVGFFKEYHDEKRLVTILGGNQSDEVNETDFKVGDVIDIRWLETTAVSVDIGSATDPKFAALLNLIASGESGGNYNAFFGNINNSDHPQFTAMSVKQVRQWQDAFVASGKKSSAVGKYQIIRKTLDSLKKSLKLTGDEIYNENLQDRMAMQLLKGRHLDEYLSGKLSRTGLGNFLAMEWASLPVLSNIKGAHRQVVRGQSYYAGDNLNNAHLQPAQVEHVLDALKT